MPMPMVLPRADHAESWSILTGQIWRIAMHIRPDSPEPPDAAFCEPFENESEFSTPTMWCREPLVFHKKKNEEIVEVPFPRHWSQTWLREHANPNRVGKCCTSQGQYRSRKYERILGQSLGIKLLFLPFYTALQLPITMNKTRLHRIIHSQFLGCPDPQPRM